MDSIRISLGCLASLACIEGPKVDITKAGMPICENCERRLVGFRLLLLPEKSMLAMVEPDEALSSSSRCFEC